MNATSCVDSITLTTILQALPKPGAQVQHDPEAIASWSYDPSTRTMVSYDSPQVAAEKVEYIKRMGLGGGMWWESSGDHPINHEGSLIRIVVDGLGGFEGRHMEHSANTLEYPQSKYENLSEGMPNE